MKHGTVSGYSKGGCRCEGCVTAARAYWRRGKAGKKQKKEMSFQDPVDFSSRPKGTAKIEAGDVTVRKTAFNNGSTVISVMTVHTLGLVPGDMAEITYGADEIVIRRAPRQ